MNTGEKKVHKILRTAVKVKKKLPPLNLSTRTTISFFVFGIVTGYFCFIIFVMMATRNYIHLASETMFHNFENLYASSNPDVVLKMIKNPNDRVIQEAKRIRNAASRFHEIKAVDFLYQKNSQSDWNIIIGTETGWKSKNRKTVTSSKRIKDLNQALKRKLVSSSHLFFGRKNTITLYMDISRKIDRHRYVLAVTIDRQGILQIFKNHVSQFLLFSTFLFFSSILLGKLFTYFLVKPIKQLSAASTLIAAGDMNQRFRLERSDEIGVLADSLDLMAGNLEKHINEIERRMQAMETMNRIDKTVLSSISRNDLLEKVVSIVSNLFTDTGIIMTIYNREKKGFDILTFNDYDMDLILEKNSHIPEKELSEEALRLIRSRGQMQASQLNNYLLEDFNPIATSKIGYILNVPIHISEEYLGSLVLGKRADSRFNDEEIETAAMLADQVGVALESVRTFEEKENILLGILIALTRAIDAKSQWTAGHSERVARYAEGIASRKKLSESQVRDVTISALLHDIGKISVPESILDKPGKLTDEEFEKIKKHPEEGAAIIEKISAYDRMLPGILYHHERWDGTGYPFGLRDSQIPLISRIICIADVYDAITDDRPYRKGMTEIEAITFLNKNREKLFDPELVDIFIHILTEEEE